MSLKATIARLTGWPRQRRSSGSSIPPFEFEGHQFANVRLLEKQAGRVWSRAGLLSWKAEMDGRPVKVVELFSAKQAWFLERVTRHPELEASFPVLHLRRDALVVVDWIEGKELDWPRIWSEPELLDQLASLQAKLHALTLDLADTEVGYDYHAWLAERAGRFKSILPLDDALGRISRVLVDSEAPQGSAVSQPDVTPSNLVCEAGTGRIVTIDNEFITQNSYFSMDLLNTARSFGGDSKPAELRRYLEAYVQRGGNLAPIAEHEEFFGALWHLRFIGTLLQNGTMDAAVEVAEHFVEEGASTPVIRLVKEIART